MVKTYKVVRRQAMGGGRFRENGELVPEAHLWFAAAHWLHTGGLEDVEVSDEEFLAAVERYVDPVSEDDGDRILASVGLGELEVTPEDGGISEMAGHARSAPLRLDPLPERVDASVVGRTSAQVRRRHRAGAAPEQGETTIMATDAPPGAPTGRGPRTHLQKEKDMVLNVPSEGAQGVYEDQSTNDPSEQNEALTGTRPSDIEAHDTEAAFKGTQAEGGSLAENTGIAENPVAEPVGANLETGSVGRVPPLAERDVVDQPATEGAGTPAAAVTVSGDAEKPAAPSITSDAEKPAAPSITSPQAGSVQAGSVEVSGTAEQDGTVTIYDGEATIGTASASGGSFSTSVSLAAGDHKLSACVTVDGATSEWSQAVEVTAS